jgi:hypothetical protein
MGCFQIILFLAGFVLVLVSFIRWFEQTTEAVDNGWWNKAALLVMFPFATWFFPSRVATGRAVPAPRHEPVRGFGSLPKTRPVDGPPPGTPKEFLEPPKVTVAKPRTAADPDKIARLKQKMREQGMLPPDAPDGEQ